MRVSVVTPSFNMKRYLAQTIESVIANLRPGDEYFVIDGGSTDGSAELIRGYADHVTGWQSEPDEGYADALAKGFSRATGDILCWINCGDLFLHGGLDAARAAFHDTGADLVFGDDFYIDEDDKVISFSRGYIGNLRSAMLYGGWTPLQDACFWRRELYHQVGGIDPRLKYAADYDLFLRMALRARIAYVPIAFSAFRRHQGQKSIAGATAYHAERKSVRVRELAAHPAMQRGLLSAAHGFAVRWRIHVAQRGWHRADLHGRPVTGLRAASYWPAR